MFSAVVGSAVLAQDLWSEIDVGKDRWALTAPFQRVLTIVLVEA